MITKKLFLVASGSGGHIVPALVLARQWREQNSDGQVWFFTGKKKLDQQLVQEAPEIFRTVSFELKTFSLRAWWNIPLLIGQLVCSFFKSLWYVIKERPEKIITTGGLVGLPLCIAGRLRGVTIEVYELNAVPGKAVKALMPFAHKIYTPFAMAAKHCSISGWNFASKCFLVPYPLRSFERNFQLKPKDVLEQINAKLGGAFFSLQRKTLFVLGGSQGSAFLNRIVLQVLEESKIEPGKLQIIHQTGSQDKEYCAEWYKQRNIPAYVFEFDPEISNYYRVADLVLSRAGAGTLFELVYFNKRSIIIPLMTLTTTHQKDNAHALAEQHPNLFTVFDQAQLEQQGIQPLVEIFFDFLIV